MPPSYFPLRWESTGEQWWYASPIDWAAANGLYDLVAELLHLDTNLLIKLTSLRRIRRLETVWDDNNNNNNNDGTTQFQGVAKCRSQVARNLMLECETGIKGQTQNSLVRAGYGGWLLYTAASAGDVGFVRELLGRYPSLVFGEGEYGVTDMFYAAARSKNCEVFKVLLDYALSPNSGEELEEIFKRDMVNRAVHAAARGGNWEILKQLVNGSVCGVLGYRDAQGCTVLHTAAGRGQVEVVRNLLALFDIINLTDSQGNTALHVASYRGYLPVLEVLILASPSLALLTNHHGDTFLHLAVAGFKSPGFRRLDKHTELMKQLVSGKIVNIQDIINVKNNDGRTALHVSLIDNIQCELVELLMSVPSIDLNIIDAYGMTPLDLLKQRQKSASSDILIRRLISSGGVCNCQENDAMVRNNYTLFTHLKGSPGTSFRIPDAEIFLYTGIENNESNNANCDQATSVESYSCSSELSNYEAANSPCNNSKSNSVNHAARRLKFLLRWPKRRETKAVAIAASESEDDDDNDDNDDSVDPFSSSRNLKEFPIPLRQRYSQSQPCSLVANNKRTTQCSMRSTFVPSPSSRMNFTAGLTQGVIQLKPQKGPFCSNRSIDDGTLQLNHRNGSFNNKKFMNRYFSFGAHGLMTMEDSNGCCESNGSCKRLSSLVA